MQTQTAVSGMSIWATRHGGFVIGKQMGATYIIYGEATWTTTAARDAARTRLTDAIAQYNTKNGTNIVADIVLPTGTSMKITISTGPVPELSTEMVNGAYASWTQVGGRFVSGWMSLNRLPA